MLMSSERILRSSVGTIVSLLVDGEYETLAAMTCNERYTASDLEEAVTTYGRNLVEPPDGIPPDLDFVEIDGASPRQVAAVLSLWTAQEGQSDLSMELTFTEVASGLWQSRIDTIHVM